jgi:hypothetical protein
VENTILAKLLHDTELALTTQIALFLPKLLPALFLEKS